MGLLWVLLGCAVVLPILGAIVLCMWDDAQDKKASAELKEAQEWKATKMLRRKKLNDTSK